MKIKKQIIVVGVVAALVIFAGCVSDKPTQMQNIEIKPDKKDNQTDYVNISNITNKDAISDNKKENITRIMYNK